MAGKGGSVVNAVWEIAEPIARSLGVELWDVRFEKEGADYYLRVFIDKEGGVGIDDCVEMSHAIDEPLDKADPIATGYCLEVSSPGVDRTLKTERELKYYTGREVDVRLYGAIDGIKEFTGTLTGSDGKTVTVEAEGREFTFKLSEAVYVKLAFRM